MLKIFGRVTSSNVQEVLWACAELDLAFERSDIGGPFGGNDQPEYLALNPNGLIPTIIDDGFVLWESNAIVRYLAARHGEGTLWPRDLQVRASADRWMDWQISVASPALFPVFWGLIRTAEDKRDPEAIAVARDRLARALKMLDGFLADHAFTAGDAFSMGDIPVGIIAYRWYTLPIMREDMPHLARWYAALKQRPGFQRHIALPLE
jgi:glutathione S-transferase